MLCIASCYALLSQLIQQLVQCPASLGQRSQERIVLFFLRFLDRSRLGQCRLALRQLRFRLRDQPGARGIQLRQTLDRLIRQRNALVDARVRLAGLSYSRFRYSTGIF